MPKFYDIAQPKATILVVEDSPTQLEALRFLLEDEGFPVIAANNGREGFEAAKANKVDLVITDIVMPELDGYELCMALRGDFDLKNLPVILLTSLADPQDVIHGLESGANNFICKPYDDEILLARVKNVLMNQELRKTASSEMGISIFFAGQRFFITADRLQILDLLLSTYENAVSRNNELIRARDELRNLNEQLEARVAERTAALTAEVEERRQAEEELRWQTAMKEAINQVLLAAINARTDTEFAGICLAEAMGLTDSGFGWIGEMKPAGGLETMAISDSGWQACGIPGIDPTVMDQSEIMGVLERMLKNGAHPAGKNAGPAAGRAASGDQEEFPVFLCVPLKHDGEIFGMVALGGKPHGYAPGDRETIEALNVALVETLQRRKAEAERDRLTKAIEQTGETIVITDPDGTIQYVNPAFEKTSGYSRAEAIGNKPGIIKSGQHGNAFYESMWQTISSGQIWEGRLVNKRKDGNLFTEAVTISPVFDANGKIMNYVAVKKDITEHLRLEAQFQQAQKMESVGRLAGGVAHDFNNMLGVISGHAELAMEQVDRDLPLFEDLKEILKAAERSAGLTRQLLAFARQQTIAPKVLDLNEMVEGMLKMLRRLIGEDIHLSWKGGKNLWAVKMDPSQIDQILANLCVNARDAISGVGTVTIETDTAAFSEEDCVDLHGFVPGEYVVLAVSDDGSGMEKETLNKLFEPFFTTKELGKGTGLGLSTVYGIVRQNNGFINVYSEPGKGTTFRIYLPREAELSAQTQRDAPKKQMAQGNETILLVEDEAAILQMARMILERQGYTVIAASSPAEACKRAEAYDGKIHLLMTDVVMPLMNGKDLSERIKVFYPDIKLLFMSGYTTEVIAHRGVLDAGVNFIQKPFSIKDICSKIREVLDMDQAPSASGNA